MNFFCKHTSFFQIKKMPHTNPSSIANPDSGCNLKGPALFNGVIFIGNADIAKAGQITEAGVMVVK